MPPGDSPCHPAQRRKLVPLDVDLSERYRPYLARQKIVDAAEWHCKFVPVAAFRLNRRVARINTAGDTGDTECGNAVAVGGGARCDLQRQTQLPRGAAQTASEVRLGLDRKNLPAPADEASHRISVRPTVSADVQRD